MTKILGILLILLVYAAPGQAQNRVLKGLRVVYAGVALQDIVYTTACVARNECRELNQTFTPIIRRGGIEAAMMVKGAEHGAIVLASEHWEQSHPTATKRVLLGLIGAQVAVNVHNWRQLQHP